MEDKKTILFQLCQELFCKKRLKDTAVADITCQAGFSVGTFYNYYPSKDKLFIEILKQETAELLQNIMNSVNPDDEPVKLIKQFLAMNMEGMLSNPILRQWYNPEVYNKIEKLFREEDGLGTVDFLYSDFLKPGPEMASEVK